MFLISRAYQALDSAQLQAWDWSATSILYVSFAWNPACDGAQALSGRRLVKTILSEGGRVHVVASKRASEEFSDPRYDVTLVPSPPFPAGKVSRALRMINTGVPEAEGGWVLPAVDAGRRVLASMPPDTIIYSRAMPGSSNIAAWHLARLTGLPWVAHFSDEWPSVQARLNGRRWLAPYKWPLFRLWRDRIMRDAGALTFTNPCQGEDFLGPSGHQHLSKTFVVAHLPTHVERRTSAPQYNVFHIVHTGNFYPPQHTSAGLMQGIRRFIDRTPAARGRVLFSQAGWEDGDVPMWTSRLGLSDVVCRLGHLDQHRLDKLLDDASLLVGIDYARPTSSTVLSKLPDYIGAGRPILAITAPRSSLGRLFSEDGAGLTAHYDDADEVASRIGVVFDAWQRHATDDLLPKQSAIDSFAPRRVLGELAGALRAARRTAESSDERRGRAERLLHAS